MQTPSIFSAKRLNGVAIEDEHGNKVATSWDILVLDWDGRIVVVPIAPGTEASLPALVRESLTLDVINQLR